MIKLFLITLLCVAVLADSPMDEFNQMMETGRKMAEQGMKMMTGQGSPLVRRATLQQSMGPSSGQGPGRGPPPPSGPSGQGQNIGNKK